MREKSWVPGRAIYTIPAMPNFPSTPTAVVHPVERWRMNEPSRVGAA